MHPRTSAGRDHWEQLGVNWEWRSGQHWGSTLGTTGMHYRQDWEIHSVLHWATHWAHHWEMHSGHRWDWHWVGTWVTLGPLLGDELGPPWR
jgi:hypothetical protein